jgi:hypothetical protein
VRVRWDTVGLLTSTRFKCTGAADEVAKEAVTTSTTAVLQADFYRAGDGNDESFTAQMIVSDPTSPPTSRACRTSGCRGSAAARRS